MIILKESIHSDVGGADEAQEETELSGPSSASR
jgi:hypothetical protein